MSNEEFYTQVTLPHLIEKASFKAEAIPETIGPYKIESLLSSGGMSLVYLGLLPEDNTPIVIKVLSPRFAKMPEMVTQFLGEAEVISVTNHPNIIKLFGQGEWEGGLYIAMEFIQGISLKQFIMQQTLSLRSSLDVALQVAYALLHLHTHGVIHRDLKPENILISENGQVKVIDFGISQLVESDKSLKGGPGQFIGTPSYMSPEQKKDPKSVTPATDIYALGVITYELISGKLCYGTIQLSLMPKGMQRIIKKCLEPNLDDRYQDIVDFITDISQYINSDALKKDRAGGDEVKEVLELISASHARLLPNNPPKWQQVDIGFATAKNIATLGLFYDFIMLPSGEHLIYVGEFDSHEVDSLASIGEAKGLIHALTNPSLRDSEKLINLPDLIHSLNILVFESPYLPAFKFAALLLTADCEDFTLFLAGMQPSFHTNFGSLEPRILPNENPRIGETPSTRFEPIRDSWNEGDILHLHTFPQTDTLPAFITEYRNLTPEKQSLSIFRRLAEESTQFVEQNCPHALFTLQRIR